jgi:hypothetical protein
MSDTKPVNTLYMPTPDEAKTRTALYKELAFMRELKQNPMPHFANGPHGERSWNTMLDDSEAILNMTTLTREEQGKAEWQSNANVGGAEVRAKMRAIAAGIGLKVPDMLFEATDSDGIKSNKHAEIFKNIVQASYRQGNPTLDAFLETWHLLGHGVVFEYEGYKTGGAQMETVESFDTRTGEVKTKKEYVKMDGKPINALINPQEFFWKTFFVRDIQAQPKLAWVQNYTKREVELEFSKYPNYKYIMDKKTAGNLLSLNDSTFYRAWAERVQNTNDYEVIRMYSKEDDGSDGSLKGYEVWVNGIPMLRCPLLWGEKEKRYPFIKQVPEYFANTNFFVGLPFPILMEGYHDNKNMLLNSLVDKVARGLDPVKLVSLGNRDLLDVEADIQQGSDNTIYVPDIEGVRFMEHPPVNQGEIVLLNMLNQGMELISVDRSQQGISSGTEKTAREAVIADQRAEELKGPIYTALEDLWYQKTKLRTTVILSHYLKDKAAADTIKGQIITVKDYTFADGTRGTLDIHVAKTKGKLLSQMEIEAREQAMEQQGKPYKLVSMLSTYLDDWEYDVSIVPGSFHKRDRVAAEDEVMGELEVVTKLFPEFYVANKHKYLAEVLELRGHHIDDYNPPAAPAPAPAGPGMPEGATMAPAPAGASPLDQGAAMLPQ